MESDQYFKDRKTIESTFENKQFSEEWLAYAYSFLTNENADVCSKGYTPHCFADDMYYGDRDGNYDSDNINSLSYNKRKMTITMGIGQDVIKGYVKPLFLFKILI